MKLGLYFMAIVFAAFGVALMYGKAADREPLEK